jgi:biopolymer transport protein ExbB/TolQ
MMNLAIVEWVHTVVPLLLYPVIVCLFGCLVLACVDGGVLLGERAHLRRAQPPGELSVIERRARRRIERVDILTRLSPMLGLMATLISLGPGLTALSNGNLDLLAESMLTAFDATVLGLAAGALGFVIARLRRRWYDEALNRWERQD